MPKMREMTAVDADYALVGPNQSTLRQQIDVPASTLFNCLADGPAWKEWINIDVEWTTPEPRGVGTKRNVSAAGGMKVEEYFLTWDEGERMAFRFDRTTLPVQTFAEHYECVSRGDSCELEWSYAFEWNGPLGSVGARGFGAAFAFNGRRALKKLAALLEVDSERFAVGNSN